MEYLLKVYSYVTINGEGKIDIDVDDFSLYYDNYLTKSHKKMSLETLEKALDIYFDQDLDIDCDYIEYNTEDLQKLLKVLE